MFLIKSKEFKQKFVSLKCGEKAERLSVASVASGLFFEINGSDNARLEKIAFCIVSDTRPTVYHQVDSELFPPSFAEAMRNNVVKFTFEDINRLGEFVVEGANRKQLALVLASENKYSVLAPEIVECKEENIGHRLMAILLAVIAFMLFALYSGYFDELEKRYALLISAVGSAFAFFGLRFEKAQFWALIDDFCKIIGYRNFNIATTILLLISLYYLYNPIYCIYESYQYNKKIDKSSKTAIIAEKIDLSKNLVKSYPNRIEGYYVISKIVDDLRASDRNLLKEFSDELIDDEEFESSITNFINGDFECSCTNYEPSDIEHTKRQVLNWYFYRYAESFGIKEEALPAEAGFENLLSTEVKKSNYYKLRKSVWEFESRKYDELIEYVGNTKNINERLVDDLNNKFESIFEGLEDLRTSLYGSLVEDDDTLGIRSEFPNDFLVQASLDKMFSHDLRICDFKSARTRIAELIHLRRRARDNSNLWLESAEKFEVFQFFRLARSSQYTMGSQVYLPAYNLHRILEKCSNWTPKLAEEILVDLKTDFPEWLKANEAAWLSGAVEGKSWSELNSTIVNMSQQAWRY